MCLRRKSAAPPDRARLASDYAAARRALDATTDELDALIRQSVGLAHRFGSDDLDRVIRRVQAEREQTERRVTELRAQLDAPDMAQSITLLRMIRANGVRAFLAAASDTERRAIVEACI